MGLLGSLQGNAKISMSFREEHSRGSPFCKHGSVLSVKVLLRLSLGVSALHDGILGTFLANAANMTSPWGREVLTDRLPSAAGVSHR